MNLATIISRLLCIVPAFLLLNLGCSTCMRLKDTKPLAEKNEIKIGVIAGPETELMEVVKSVAAKEHNLKLDLVIFNDYVTPNIALNDGSIDANAFQHEPYLLEMVKSRGFAIKAVAKTFIYPLAAYSKTLSSTKDLKDGAKIAIPNDPSNGARALLLLEKQGLIKLKDNKNLLCSVNDIIENRLHLKIIELEAAQLPRALEDVAMAIINTTFAKVAKLSPLKNGLFMEDASSPYVNIIAVRIKDEDAHFVKKLISSVQNDRVAKAAAEIFEGAAIPSWTVIK